MTRSDAAPRRVFSTNEGSQEGTFAPFDWLLLATAASIWGSSFFFIAVGLDHFAPGVVTFGRLAFGAVALWSLPAARNVRIDPSDRGRIILLAVCWMAFPLSMFSVAEQWIDSSLAGMLNGAMPIFTALVATSMLRRPPGPILTWGLLVGFAGVLVLSWPSVREADASALGVLLVVLATLSYGVASNVAVPLQQRYGAIPILARGQLIALVLVSPGLLVGAPSSSFDVGSLAAVIALGALGTGLAFVAGATLMGRVGATRGSVITYLMPVVSIALGVAFRDEIFDWYGAVGVVLVLTGAYLASRAKRPEPIPIE